MRFNYAREANILKLKHARNREGLEPRLALCRFLSVLNRAMITETCLGRKIIALSNTVNCH